MKKGLFTSLLLAGIGSNVFAISYFQDFEGTVGSEWSSSNTMSFNGTQVSGQWYNNTLSLTLSGLSSGDVVNIAFDFYAFDSWDGNQNPGPDRFTFDVDSVIKLDSTFANRHEWVQSYPNAYLAANVPGFTNPDDMDVQNGGTLPNGFYGNSLYKFGGSINSGFSAVATGSSMVLNFTGSNLQGAGDEGWGIDNVRVESVPEPMSMIALGGAVLALLRRRVR